MTILSSKPLVAWVLLCGHSAVRWGILWDMQVKLDLRDKKNSPINRKKIPKLRILLLSSIYYLVSANLCNDVNFKTNVP